MSQVTVIPEETDTTPRPNIPAYIALGVGLLILGISANLIRMAGAPGPVSGFYRMAIGFLTLSGLIVTRRKRLRFNRAGLIWAALAGLAIGIDMTMWTTGIMLSGPTMPTLLGNTTPLWVGLAVMVIDNEKHPTLFWVGLAVTLGGAVSVVGRDALVKGSLDLGAFLGLISAMFYSAFFLLTQRARRHTDALTTLWVTSFFAALVTLGAALIFNQPLTGYSLRTYLIFAIMGVVIQVVAWLLITFSQGHIPASVVAPTLLGQPVLTAIFAVPLVGETLDKSDLVGGAIVLVGVFLVHFSKQKKR
jgi:drug/metabolite transporter (DMT)-like permease